jgi:hypothetical protein
MKLLADITKWLGAVIGAWYGWVGASATAGIVGFGQGMGWWGSPGKRIYFGLLVVGSVVSAFQAWRKEYSGRLVEQERRLAWETRFNNEEPRIMFGLLAPMNWNNLDILGEFVFTVTNYGKRPALYVKIEPLKSPSENFTIDFGPLDVLPPDSRYRAIQHAIDDGNKRSELDKRKLWEFFHNCPIENRTVETFDVFIKFKDRDEDKQTVAKMQFDLNSKELTILPH